MFSKAGDASYNSFYLWNLAKYLASEVAIFNGKVTASELDV